MEAMILAAGLGTRLGALTQNTPKALVDIAGASALERVARSLIAAGVDRLIINVHHHADAVVQHVEERGGFGVDVAFSREEGAPLETGGGVRAAAPLFRGHAPFFLHNVDVVTDADLPGMYADHQRSDALVTLAVSDRSSSRSLLFDDLGLLGRADRGRNVRTLLREPVGTVVDRPFAGIHVASPELLTLFTETGAFSIMETYMRLAAAGQRIRPFDISGARWLEIGTPQRLEAARQALGS
jgi:N-acetyl-alpha-D-muramate 1-phosphate uridylyltransferase